MIVLRLYHWYYSGGQADQKSLNDALWQSWKVESLCIFPPFPMWQRVVTKHYGGRPQRYWHYHGGLNSLDFLCCSNSFTEFSTGSLPGQMAFPSLWDKCFNLMSIPCISWHRECGSEQDYCHLTRFQVTVFIQVTDLGFSFIRVYLSTGWPAWHHWKRPIPPHSL